MYPKKDAKTHASSRQSLRQALSEEVWRASWFIPPKRTAQEPWGGCFEPWPPKLFASESQMPSSLAWRLIIKNLSGWSVVSSAELETISSATTLVRRWRINTMMRRKAYAIALLSVLALIGIMMLLFSTRWGIGLSPDSSTYIAAARNLLNGRGLSVLSGDGEPIPMIRFPPLFPALLALMGTLGIDPLNGARWLNTFFFAANILLVGLVIYRYTRSSLFTSMLGSFLMLSSTHMLKIHSMAWTEPAFIFFGLFGLFLMAAYLERPRLILLLACSLPIALAFLTRYLGLALVTSGLLGIFFFSRQASYRRSIASIIFAGLTCFPMALWIRRNVYVAGRATGRKMVFHVIGSGHVNSALSTLSTWLFAPLVPGVGQGVLLQVGATSVLALIILLLLREKKLTGNVRTNHPVAKMLPLLATFICSYGILLAVSISFFDAQTPLDDRILSPIYTSGLILFLCLGHKAMTTRRGNHAIGIFTIVLCIALAASYAARATTWVIRMHTDGQGYASRAWRDSEIMERIRNLPSGTPIYSNGADAIYLLTGRPASMLPANADPASLQINGSYMDELIRMKHLLAKKDGVLVYLNAIAWRRYLPSETKLKEQLTLRLLTRGVDGSIYKCKC